MAHFFEHKFSCEQRGRGLRVIRSNLDEALDEDRLEVAVVTMNVDDGQEDVGAMEEASEENASIPAEQVDLGSGMNSQAASARSPRSPLLEHGTGRMMVTATTAAAPTEMATPPRERASSHDVVVQKPTDPTLFTYPVGGSERRLGVPPLSLNGSPCDPASPATPPVEAHSSSSRKSAHFLEETIASIVAPREFPELPQRSLESEKLSQELDLELLKEELETPPTFSSLADITGSEAPHTDTEEQDLTGSPSGSGRLLVGGEDGRTADTSPLPAPSPPPNPPAVTQKTNLLVSLKDGARSGERKGALPSVVSVLLPVCRVDAGLHDAYLLLCGDSVQLSWQLMWWTNPPEQPRTATKAPAQKALQWSPL